LAASGAVAQLQNYMLLVFIRGEEKKQSKKIEQGTQIGLRDLSRGYLPCNKSTR